MTVKKFMVKVTQTIEVILDDEKLNDEFNDAFSSCMWDVNSLEDHATHLAQLKARGVMGLSNNAEMYGDLNDMNCSVKDLDCEEEIESSVEIEQV